MPGELNGVLFLPFVKTSMFCRRQNIKVNALKARKYPVVAIVVSFFLFFTSPAQAIRIEILTGSPLTGRSLNGRPMEVAAEQALVKFSSSTDSARREAVLAAIGGQILQELDFVGWTLVGLPAGMRVADGMNSLRGLPEVEAIEPNRVYRANKVPNDPAAASQYALSQVNAFGAWEFEVGNSSRVTIAVVDSGIDGSQPDLAGKLVGTSKFFEPLPDNKVSRAPSADNQPPTAACNHATHVAGVAAASSDNGVGIAGMSWGAKLISLKVFKDGDCTTSCGDAPGKACGTTDTAVLSAIDYATTLHNSATTGRIIVNLSLGDASSPPCGAAMQAAISSAAAAGLVIVAAAGNNGSSVESPGNCNNLIPVGATDPNNNIASFSSQGPALSNNGLVAPGVDVLTTDLNSGYVTASGTSFSAPMVAGAAALILSAKPTLTREKVSAILRGSADNIGVSGLALKPNGNAAGAGRLNAFRAMRLAVNGTLADFDGDVKAIAFPNPYRPAEGGRVTFSVPTAIQGANTIIKIYTLSGQLVKQLSTVTWDGNNGDGQSVAAGTYLFMVTTSVGKARGRMAVIR